MKKKPIITIIICLVIVGIGVGALLLAKGVKSEMGGLKGGFNNKNSTNSQETANDTVKELADVTLDWWELYNPNGFDTLTAVITNPNSIAVDVSYDVVYYKNGKEVARSEDFANFSIMPNGKSIVWANFDIPKNNEVDDVKLEKITTTETNYPPIDGKYSRVGLIGNEETLEFEFEKKPTLATIHFLLYNDNNKNGKFDKGEIVVVGDDSIMEQKGKAKFEVDVFSFTNYDVYFTAY